jgi:hypothetical protein
MTFALAKVRLRVAESMAWVFIAWCYTSTSTTSGWLRKPPGLAVAP